MQSPLLFPLQAFAAPIACPPGDANFPSFYDDATLFTDAIAAVAKLEPSNQRLTGITVPHHLLVADLVALGFHAASGFRYKRIVILSPDHFHKTQKLFATTTRGFDTVLGPVLADTAAVRLLEANSDMVEDSCLFAKEHGVQAMLPFLHHYFPEAEIVPVAMSVKARRADWDRLAEALKADRRQGHADRRIHRLLALSAAARSQALRPADAEHARRRLARRHRGAAPAGSCRFGRRALHPDQAAARTVRRPPLVVANENSQAHTSDYVERTTSYVVALFGAFGPGFNNPARPNDKIYYFAGDVNFGRAMKKILVRDGVADRIVDSVLALTGSRPLIVNLEGVILPNVPEAIDDMTLAMPEDLAVGMLKRLHVAGVSLANNHAYRSRPVRLCRDAARARRGRHRRISARARRWRLPISTLSG